MQAASLKSEDWLDLALEELKSSGYAALRALSLAKKLGVSRGSFYHHFESLDAFHRAVIAHWSERSSGDLMEATLAANDPALALDELLRQTLRSGAQLERAVRSWATVKHLVAVELALVDARRINVAEDLLARCGVPTALAAPRARMLYWAAIGRLMMPFPEENTLSNAEISDLAALMRHT